MALLNLVVASLALNTFAATPNVTRISPLAAVPGKTTVITLLGDNLQGAVDLWTSFPCEVAPAKSSDSTAFELKVPTQTTGIGAIRLITTNGLSSLHLLLIDFLPTVEAAKTNHSPATAQRLLGQVAVDGVCEELRSDFYRVTAKKGDRLSIEVVAQRLGSPLDPLLRLLDTQGRELAANDDAPGLGADARLDFNCPKTGEYLIEVRDTQHAGGARHRYRLRVGTPLPTPLRFLTSPEVSKLTEPIDPPRSANEVEPNDDGTRAQLIRLPVEVAGRFDRPGDRDVFEFQAGKGERIVFAGRTRSLGSPCDLFLQLQTTNGTKLAEANATGSDEGILTNRFNADGAYRLVVEELNRNGGPAFAYRVASRELKPGFALSTETERVSVPAGDSIEIEVKPDRREYDGPIQLTVVGLPESFSVSNAVITAKTNATKLRISAPSDLALGDFFLFSIVGSAVIDGANVSERTSTLPALRSLFPELRHPPAELDGLISLSISESKSSNPKPPQKKRRK
jgi:hypothetical protein